MLTTMPGIVFAQHLMISHFFSCFFSASLCLSLFLLTSVDELGLERLCFLLKFLNILVISAILF